LRERNGCPVEVFDAIFEVIDTRSFSNLWYWIALAVLWSSASHWVLGVPHDMIQRGRREGGPAQQDVEDLARINTGRLLHLTDRGAAVLLGVAAFWMSALTMLAFYYGVEFAQALFFLMAPAGLVLWMSIRAARRIAAGANTGEALYRQLIRHRRWTQVVGMVAIFATGMFGTWSNLSQSVLN